VNIHLADRITDEFTSEDCDRENEECNRLLNK
jgi:hypothetical protein